MSIGRLRKNFINCAIVLLLFDHVSSEVQAREKVDLSFKGGLFVGSVEKTIEATGKKETLIIGGVPFSIGYNIDIHRWLTAQVEGQLSLDIPNQQIIRQGINLQLAWHLWGGARNLHERYANASIVTSHSYNFSFLYRVGMHRYSGTSVNNPNRKLTGSVLDNRIGIEYRVDVSSESAWGMEVTNTVLNLPMSTERISPQIAELSVFWRGLI